MKKGVGSGYPDPDPLVKGTDPHQNATDPQHRWQEVFYLIANEKNSPTADPVDNNYLSDPNRNTEGRTPISGPLREELPCLISCESFSA